MHMELEYLFFGHVNILLLYPGIVLILVEAKVEWRSGSPSQVDDKLPSSVWEGLKRNVSTDFEYVFHTLCVPINWNKIEFSNQSLKKDSNCHMIIQCVVKCWLE